MRNSRNLIVVLAAAGALAALSFSGGARAAQDTPARALKIAVVNMNDCMEASKNDQAKDLEAKFATVQRDAREELNKVRKKVDELKAQAKSLEESGARSPLYLKVVSDLKIEEARFEILTQMSRQQLIAARDSFRTQIYSDARKVATLVAKDLKFDLVLRSDEGAFDEDSSDLALQRNMLRSVLYHDPSLDITQKVLARLNEDYQKKKKN